MNRYILLPILTMIFFSGCTQVVTAPISVAGSVVGAAVDIASSGDTEEDDKK